MERELTDLELNSVKAWLELSSPPFWLIKLLDRKVDLDKFEEFIYGYLGNFKKFNFSQINYIKKIDAKSSNYILWNPTKVLFWLFQVMYHYRYFAGIHLGKSLDSNSILWKSVNVIYSAKESIKRKIGKSKSITNHRANKQSFFEGDRRRSLNTSYEIEHMEYSKNEVTSLKEAKVLSNGLILYSGKVLVVDPGVQTDKFSSGIDPQVFLTKKIGNIHLSNFEEFEVQNAIDLTGRNAQNYWHSLIEYLPRMSNLDFVSDSKFRNFAILVSSQTPKSIVNLIKLLWPCNKIILIDHRSIAKVRNLLIPSFISRAYDSGVMYPEEMFHIKSQNLVNFKRFVERTIKYNYIQSDGIQSKYIFLNRLSSYRNVKIRSVFFESLKKMGFSIHDPASMNIFDQIRMFYGAKAIVGIGGAAWANIIFTKASITSIVSIASAPFDVHRNIAEIFNLNYSIIASSALKKNLKNPFYRNFVHSDFSIDRNCEDMIIQDIVDKIQKL